VAPTDGMVAHQAAAAPEALPEGPIPQALGGGQGSLRDLPHDGIGFLGKDLSVALATGVPIISAAAASLAHDKLVGCFLSSSYYYSRPKKVCR